MIPVDTADIRKEYQILLHELEQFNPELLDKKRVLAITKSDQADKEILRELKKDLPEIPYVFISSHQTTGLEKLTGILWEALNQ